MYFAARGLINGEANLPSPLTGKQFVLVGAGGAGRALSFGAKSRGARVIVFDIDYGMFIDNKLNFNLSLVTTMNSVVYMFYLFFKI